ncbi:MAG: hypothetical protein JXM68_11655 [Sedimentisphaerales bacterium]|nr:hypothetical protein [Sedimentisphaerales bacterium]
MNMPFFFKPEKNGFSVLETASEVIFKADNEWFSGVNFSFSMLLWQNRENRQQKKSIIVDYLGT